MLGKTSPNTRRRLRNGCSDSADLYEARLSNALEGLAGHSAGEEVSRRYGVPTGRELLQQHIAYVDDALERSTPDEQESFLMMENRDWRGYAAKHGAEITTDWLLTSFDLNPEEIVEGISEGLITDADALRLYGERALREARDRYNYETIGPDTEEQGEISLRAYEAFKATEKQLEPVLKGTRAEQAAFCVWMAERVTAEVVVFCVRMDEQATAEAVANWHKMAARVAGSAI